MFIGIRLTISSKTIEKFRGNMEKLNSEDAGLSPGWLAMAGLINWINAEIMPPSMLMARHRPKDNRIRTTVLPIIMLKRRLPVMAGRTGLASIFNSWGKIRMKKWVTKAVAMLHSAKR